ncbi:MAG: hypothetical protein AAFV86_01190 [Pseudomonadota bacterium]
MISNIVERNVFTDFDIKLSRHLASVRSGGFPQVTVSQRMRVDDPAAPWSERRNQHFTTVPHALRAIARRALGDAESAEITFADTEGELERVDEGPKRVVDKSEIKVFGQALEFCRTIGAFEFLELSGDYDMLMVQPMGAELTPITIDLFRGMARVPPSIGRHTEVFNGPLYELRRRGHEDETARAYFAAARRAMTMAREDAVLDFRAAAEDRIHAFDRALCGRAITGHRLDATLALVARLRTGLGETLHGISEDARITALDWAEAVDRGFEGETGARSRGESGREGRSPRPRRNLFECRAAAAAP